jgi:hypothetical protein
MKQNILGFDPFNKRVKVLQVATKVFSMSIIIVHAQTEENNKG